MAEEKIRVIILQEEGVWVAQCIDFDICVQADDLDAIPGRLQVALRLEEELHGGDLNSIGPAPKHFQEMWERRSGSYAPASQISENYEIAMHG